MIRQQKDEQTDDTSGQTDVLCDEFEVRDKMCRESVLCLYINFASLVTYSFSYLSATVFKHNWLDSVEPMKRLNRSSRV